MNEALINGGLSISYPDGFHVMDDAEQARIFLEEAPNRWGIWDTGRHIIIALMWNTSSGFLAKLSSPKSQAERVEARARKAYKAAGYRCLGFSETQVAGRDAHAVRFEYQVQGVQQVAEVAVFNDKATYYFVYGYLRKENAEVGDAVLDEVLASIRLAGE